MTTLLVGTREAIPVLVSLSTCLDNSFIRCVIPEEADGTTCSWPLNQ